MGGRLHDLTTTLIQYYTNAGFIPFLASSRSGFNAIIYDLEGILALFSNQG